jgi:Ca2+-binding RTX toxin-like protein
MKRIIATLTAALVLAVPTVALAHHNDDAPGTDGPNGKTLYVGTAHADDLRGGSAPDEIRALAGDDRLGGEHGPDLLKGGAGDDRIWPGRGKDTVICGRGEDRVFTLKENPGDDIAGDCEVIVDL